MDFKKLEEQLFSLPESDLTDYDKQLRFFSALEHSKQTIQVGELRAIIDDSSIEDLLNIFNSINESPYYDDNEIPPICLGEEITPLVCEQTLTNLLDWAWKHTSTSKKKFF